MLRMVELSESCELRVREFGTEEIGTKAKYGPIVRNVFILHYVIHGKGYFNDNEVRKGQGFLIRAGQNAKYFYDKDDPWQYFWMVFDGTKAEEICQKYINDNENGIFHFNFANKLRILSKSLFTASKSLSAAEGYSEFFKVLSFHERKICRENNQYGNDAKNYMYHRLHLPLSITDVARFLGISDRCLYNLFIKHEGTSPKQYLNELRLERAKSMLIDSCYTITEIGTAVGFSDVLTFSRFFSKHIKSSPSAYRKIFGKKLD